MYDYFVAELRCPRCGTINPTTAYTNLQTHIRGGGADGSELTVGTALAPVYLTTHHLVSAGYALITPPTAADSLRLLDVWICPVCNTEQWAMIEIDSGRIARIEAVVMNRATFEAANFIDDTHAELLAAELLGIPVAEFSERKLNSVEILLQQLS
jgi:hypothetical protein